MLAAAHFAAPPDALCLLKSVGETRETQRQINMMMSEH